MRIFVLLLAILADLGPLAVLLAYVLWAQPVLAQMPLPTPKTCKDTPAQCDKELLLLRDEVEVKRRLLAGAWAISEEWQQRAEQAEAKLKECKPEPAPPKEP